MFLHISYLEWVGYMGSVLVAVSLTMSSIVKLRWLNLVGATIFTIYGFAIAALPVGVLNLFIVLADAYYLYKIYSNKESFKVVVANLSDPYVRYFTDYHKLDIHTFFPEYEKFTPKSKDDQSTEFSFLLLSNTVVAGIFSGIRTNNTLQVVVDFVTSEYRDFKAGDFVYVKNIQFLKDQGIDRLMCETANQDHSKYLSKMGFVQQENKDGKTSFSKTI